MKVKICGITNLRDAVCACEAGADYLGFVFYPKSPRYVSEQEAAQLVLEIRREGWGGETGPELVGLFVKRPVGDINDTVETVGLDRAQLHGEYPPEELRTLNTAHFFSIRPRTADEAIEDLQRLAGRASEPGPALLLDAYVDGMWGGTGHTGDWQVAAEVCRRHESVLLAGGLNPSNVQDAIRTVRPWGVDVSGGVESAKGRKNHTAVRAFIANARRAGARSLGA